MTRAEHIAWCRQRALAELDAAGPEEAVRVVSALSSLQSDLRKHPDTEHHQGLELGALLAFHGHLRTDAQAREWIDGIQ